MLLRSTVLALLLAATLVAPPPVQAQGIIWGGVGGAVTDPSGRPISRAIVTLRPLGASGGREATADFSGRFAFTLVSPGSYELRAEALGYRPVVARTVSVGAGESSAVTLTISPAAPPVLTVDTVAIAAGVSTRWRPGGGHFSPADTRQLPDRFADLSAVAALSPHVDRASGARGLPGSTSLLIADGIPFYRAAHPVARADRLGDPIFPASVLSGLTVYHSPPDVEWAGSAGSHLAASTPSASRSGAAFDAAWSGDPLWSSTRHAFTSPALLSFRGAARADIELSPDTAGIAIGAEAFQEEMPLPPRVDATVAGTLAGLDPDLVAALSTPSTERIASYSAFARGDVRRSDTSRMFFRGLVAYSRRDFDGPGPVTLGRAVSLPEESVDYSVAGGFMSRYRPRLDIELRAGLSGSSRTFEPATAGMPPALLAGSGRTLGVLAGGQGESARTDFFVSPIIHYAVWGGTLKVGGTARLSRHRMASEVPQELIFSDGPAIVAGQGYGRSVTAPESSFSTAELGGFGQFTFEPQPRVRITFGGRFEREIVPAADVDRNIPWLQASGLPNDSFPSNLAQLSAHGALTWDPFTDGSTRFLSAISLHHGDVDPRALHETLARDVGATASVYAGSGLVWPGMSLPAGATTLPTLTLLGPDTRAPRSLNASVGVVRRLAAGWSMHVEGSYRRTDFLMRRRNLNLPAVAQAVDAYGRDVFGTLQQDGALVTATGSDARRFTAFHEIWALDPDGWSEYRGVSLALEHSGPGRHLYAAYTRSETTDNWTGAAAGAPGAELPPGLPGADWDEDTSDFDATHHVTATASFTAGFATLAAAYHFRSGLPFTPGYRAGVDANGDGSVQNDVAFIDAALAAPLLGDWACLEEQVGGFADRNSCRGPNEHTVDVRVSFALGTLWGRQASLVIDALDVVESEDGVLDTALLLVDPTGAITSSAGTVTVPVVVNPDFGRVIYRSSRGRMIRIGFRVGA
ncbi:MAG: carboxypeptidase-like regulatory domain-containing protein [Gemmatimonadota bacterium]